jgi:riboflavin synthase
MNTTMFTGIIEELGRLRSRDGNRFTFAASLVLEDSKIGDSIAVNGCCLTVVDIGPGYWTADVVDESLARTNLGELEAGDPINLERPVRLADRLGGHLVQGHVDAVGEILTPAPNLAIKTPAHLMRYIVEKGSIAVDGCSLTVVAPGDDRFTVAIIPHTSEVTTLGTKRPGAHVNLEVDMIAKYAERLLTPYQSPDQPEDLKD